MEVDLENIDLKNERKTNTKTNKIKFYILVNSVNLWLIISIYNLYSNQ